MGVAVGSGSGVAVGVRGRGGRRSRARSRPGHGAREERCRTPGDLVAARRREQQRPLGRAPAAAVDRVDLEQGGAARQRRHGRGRPGRRRDVPAVAVDAVAGGATAACPAEERASGRLRRADQPRRHGGRCRGPCRPPAQYAQRLLPPAAVLEPQRQIDRLAPLHRAYAGGRQAGAPDPRDREHPARGDACREAAHDPRGARAQDRDVDRPGARHLRRLRLALRDGRAARPGGAALALQAGRSGSGDTGGGRRARRSQRLEDGQARACGQPLEPLCRLRRQRRVGDDRGAVSRAGVARSGRRASRAPPGRRSSARIRGSASGAIARSARALSRTATYAATTRIPPTSALRCAVTCPR